MAFDDEVPPAPLPPVRGYSFTSWTSTNPDQPQPGDKLDAEIDRCNASIAEVIARLDLIQRDDGALENDSVGLDQLQDALVSKGNSLPLSGDGKYWNAGDFLVRGGPASSVHYLTPDALTTVRWVQLELNIIPVKTYFNNLTKLLRDKGVITVAEYNAVYGGSPPP